MAAAAQLLGGLLGLPEDSLPKEARACLEARLREALGVAITSVLAALAPGGGPNPKIAYKLCRFLASVVEADEAAGLLSPDDASAVANNVALAHPGSEDVQNCARWLWWLLCPARLLPDLRAALDGTGHVWALRSALWAVCDLARRRRLQEAEEFPPLILRAMVGPHGTDERVQLYAADALLVLCGSGGLGASVSLPDLSEALVAATFAHIRSWEVVERLLEVSAWTLRLGGHVRLLLDPRLAGHPDLLKRLLTDIGLRRKLEYSAEEVVACSAIAAVVAAVEASSEDVADVTMCALWGLLDRASQLGAEASDTMLEGARVVVHALTRSAATGRAPTAAFVQHAFGATLVLAGYESALVAQPLREHRDLVRGMLEARLAAKEVPHHELLTCCRLLVALWSISDMVTFVERRLSAALAHGSPADLLRAACIVVNDGAYEDQDLQPCAVAVLRMALEFLNMAGTSECSGDVLSAPAGALGVAIAQIEPGVPTNEDLIRLAMQRLLEMTKYGVELASGGFCLLHHTHWAIREAVAHSDCARSWVMNCPGGTELLQLSVQSLILGADGAVPADEADGEARKALIEGFSVLTLLQGPTLAVVAMCKLPESRAVQAAGCAALRDAAQKGLIDPSCGAARAALQQACRVCENEPEVETAACMALGLLGG